MAVKLLPDGTLEYDVWVKRGLMIVNRNALDIDDLDHLYNQIVAAGLEPEAFDIFHPVAEQYKDFTRAQLINQITSLTRDLHDLHHASGMWG